MLVPQVVELYLDLLVPCVLGHLDLFLFKPFDSLLNSLGLGIVLLLTEPLLDLS